VKVVIGKRWYEGAGVGVARQHDVDHAGSEQQ
jgi:hypothetical protein